MTIAGYGFVTALDDDFAGDTVEVGWQNLPGEQIEQQILTWPVSIRLAGDQSTSCHFDSGGPIFAGVQRGYSDEVHEIIGVIGGLPPYPTVQSAAENILGACLGGDTVNAMLGSDAVSRWVCGLANKICDNAATSGGPPG